MGSVRITTLFGIVASAILLCAGVSPDAKEDSISGWGPWSLGSEFPIHSSDYESVLIPSEHWSDASPDDLIGATLKRLESITLEHVTAKFQVILWLKPAGTKYGSLEQISIVTNQRFAGKEPLFAAPCAHLAYVRSLILRIWGKYDDSIIIRIHAVLDDIPYDCVIPDRPISLDDKFLSAVLVTKRGLFMFEDKAGCNVSVSWDPDWIVLEYVTPDAYNQEGDQGSQEGEFD